MRLTADAEAEVHAFVAGRVERAAAEGTGPVHFHCGRLADAFTRLIGVSGITFGPHVLVRAAHLRRRSGQAFLPGALVVHEAAHVHQYRALGFVPFLLAYAREWTGGIVRERSLGGAARDRAYRRIRFEREAYRIDREWTGEGGARWLPVETARQR